MIHSEDVVKGAVFSRQVGSSTFTIEILGIIGNGIWHKFNGWKPETTDRDIFISTLNNIGYAKA